MNSKRIVPSLPDDPRVLGYAKIGCLHPTVFSNWREECRCVVY